MPALSPLHSGPLLPQAFLCNIYTYPKSLVDCIIVTLVPPTLLTIYCLPFLPSCPVCIYRSKEEETRKGVKESERKEEKGGKEGGSKEGLSKTRLPKDKEVKSDDTLSNHHKLLMSWEPDYLRGLNATRAPVLFAIEKMKDKLKDIKGQH